MKKFLDPAKLNLVELFVELRNAKSTYDLNRTVEIFQPYWEISSSPDFSYFSPLIEAELLLLAGEFLLEYGKAKSKPDYISRGKDVLTNTLEKFYLLDEIDKAYEAQMLLAIGYFYEGSINEYRDFLKDAEQHFFEDQLNPVFLQIQVNYLIIELKMNRIKPAIERINKFDTIIQQSSDYKIKTLFYNQSGLIFRESEEFDKSIKYFELALWNAKALANTHYESLILNCLANSLRVNEEYEKASNYIEEAIELGKNNPGWLANFYDTKANILLDSGNLELAVEFSDRAIVIFKDNHNYSGLVESLWTQTQILFSLAMPELALESFLWLHRTAIKHLDEKTVQKYNYEFLSRIFFPTSQGWKEQNEEYKIFKVRNALCRFDGKRTKAAKSLKISHQFLGEFLDDHPDLKADFENNRKTRSDKK